MKTVLTLILLILASVGVSQAKLGIRPSYTISPTTVNTPTSSAMYGTTLTVACYMKNTGNATFSGNAQIYRFVRSDSFQSSTDLMTAYTVSLAAGDSSLVFYIDSIVPSSYRTNGNGNTVVVWPYASGIQTTDSLHTAPVYIFNSNGINELKINDIVIYPNPASEILYIKMENDAEVKTYKIYNLQAKEIARGIVTGGVNIHALPVGVYTIVVSSSENRIYKKVFNKEN